VGGTNLRVQAIDLFSKRIMKTWRKISARILKVELRSRNNARNTRSATPTATSTSSKVRINNCIRKNLRGLSQQREDSRAQWPGVSLQIQEPLRISLKKKNTHLRLTTIKVSPTFKYHCWKNQTRMRAKEK